MDKLDPLMRDILAGGTLVKRDRAAPPVGTTAPSRRRSAASRRRWAASRRRTTATIVPKHTVQPGQLASPLMRFGFPSLSLH